MPPRTFSRQDIAVSLEESPHFREGRMSTIKCPRCGTITTTQSAPSTPPDTGKECKGHVKNHPQHV